MVKQNKWGLREVGCFLWYVVTVTKHSPVLMIIKLPGWWASWEPRHSWITMFHLIVLGPVGSALHHCPTDKTLSFQYSKYLMYCRCITTTQKKKCPHGVLPRSRQARTFSHASDSLTSHFFTPALHQSFLSHMFKGLLRVSCAPSWDFFPLGNVCRLLGKKIINLSHCTRLTRTLQTGDEVPKWCQLYICLSVVPQDTGWLSKFPKLLWRLTWGLYRTRLAATHLYFLIPLWTLEEDATPNQWKILKKNQWCPLRYFKSFHLWGLQNALPAKAHCFPLSYPLSSQ